MEQTLDDAIRIRELLFATISMVDIAEFKAFRALPAGTQELVLTGTALRNDRQPSQDISLAMQAKLLGFHFTVADGSLARLVSDSHTTVETTLDPSLKSTQGVR